MQSPARGPRVAAGLLTTLVLTGALSGPLTGTASSAKERRKRSSITDDYVGTGAAGGRGIQVVTFNDDSFGGALFTPPGTYARITVEVVDAHAPDVGFVIGQDADENGFLEWSEAACSRTDEPVEVTPGAPIGVFIQQGPCQDGTPAFGTEGDITVTFLP